MYHSSIGRIPRLMTCVLSGVALFLVIKGNADHMSGRIVHVSLPSSASLPPAPSAQAVPLQQQPQAASTPGVAKVHVTSSPSGGEIYVDGKFFGNAPSEIALAPGEHVVRVTFGGKEWTRTLQITGGEIQLRAELP